MRKLQFLVDRTQQVPDVATVSDKTQAYVTSLLSEQLVQHGFSTKSQQEHQLEVSVENHPVALGVHCNKVNEEGRLVCEITANTDEEQAWFRKIETQSVIKQLAQAVEQTLKADESFKSFEWKN